MSSYKKTKSKSELAVIVDVAKRPYAIILYLRFSTLNLRDICSCIIFNEKSIVACASNENSLDALSIFIS